jgi:hypothetical protein
MVSPAMIGESKTYLTIMNRQPIMLLVCKEAVAGRATASLF